MKSMASEPGLRLSFDMKNYAVLGVEAVWPHRPPSSICIIVQRYYRYFLRQSITVKSGVL